VGEALVKQLRSGQSEASDEIDLYSSKTFHKADVSSFWLIRKSDRAPKDLSSPHNEEAHAILLSSEYVANLPPDLQTQT
jgi:hypothetical protein